MAIKTNFTIKQAGVDSPAVVSNAYCKVESVSGDKNFVVADIGIYSADQSEKVSAMRSTFKPEMNGSNFIAQAYVHMKSLDEFKNGEDC
jgi:hypothetical protein